VQTLKTAAIVVLLMCVLYGAYVSMTTPPDPLPAEIGSMLVESGEFDISDGLPESLDDLGIDSGQAAGTFADAGTPSPNFATAGSAMPGSADPNFGTVDQNYADLQQPSPASADASATYQMSDLAGAAAVSRLPEVDPSGAASAPVPEPGRPYPSTGSQFTLPDPQGNLGVSDIEGQGSAGVAEQAATLGGRPEQNQDPAASVAAAGLANAIATADRQYAEDRRREALATLSLFYETPNLSSEQREQLLVRLDPLAREVVYSKEHLLEKPHRVGPNETLMDIAQQYEVPWQLLANINGVTDPVTVLPGTDLKIVRGPFRADVDLANQELTLFLGDLYAGRFPIGTGSDPSPKPGTYTIQEKQSAKTYYDMSGTPIPPGSPRNPYGSMWIDLGSGLSIHGSPKDDQPTQDGCISVAGNYSRDIFGILSEGSSVTIR